MSMSASASAPSVRPKLFLAQPLPMLSALCASLMRLSAGAAKADAAGDLQLALQARVTQTPGAMKPSLGATSSAARPRRTIHRDLAPTMPHGHTLARALGIAKGPGKIRRVQVTERICFNATPRAAAISQGEHLFRVRASLGLLRVGLGRGLGRGLA